MLFFFKVYGENVNDECLSPGDVCLNVLTSFFNVFNNFYRNKAAFLNVCKYQNKKKMRQFQLKTFVDVTDSNFY